MKPGEMLGLDEVGAGRYRGHNLPGPGQLVFGGQILAQTVMAASRAAPDKELKSLHTVFAKGASLDTPLDFVVEANQEGRTFSTYTISSVQGDKLCSRSIALLHAPDPDLIRHGAERPAVTPPAEIEPRDAQHEWWEARVVGDVDLMDPEAVGPAELHVWSRFSDVPDGVAASQALLAYASDGFLIATAMRPHAGVGQSMAHVSISTTVMAQTLDFHEPFDASEWHLLAHSSPYAGRGRSFGRADVWTEDGRLVASYSQENMVRDFPGGKASSAKSRF